MAKTTGWQRIIPGRKTAIVFGIIIVLFIAAHFALAPIVRHYVNKTLNEIPGYFGHVDDINIHLWRGAYQIVGLTLEKSNGKIPVPFFSAEVIDLSTEWSEIFRGHLVGTIRIDHPKLNFVAGPTEATSQKSVDDSWLDKVKKLFPLKINSFTVINGEMHFRNFYADPKVDLYLTDLDMVATNLTNSRKLSKNLVAHIEAEGLAMKEGHLKVNCDLDPYADQPTFSLDLSLSKLHMTRLNDYLKAYAKFDVQEGTFGCYAEFVAADGNIKGYLKPVMENLKIVDWGEDIKKPLKLLWELVIGAVADIFLTNQPKDRVATKIPIEGKFKDPHTNVLAVIGGLLRNAFIRAIIPGVEGELSLKDVKKDAKEGKK